ncbi:MAG TPA: TIGR00282 family metallophosphoesterase [Candidatus Saccharimonadales bacterium]|nr:TIGR00282 family metallophosphoesterase [Candidatus Saccharimonadales bacterium]
MNILYVGDVMGEPGLQVVERVLPELRTQRKIDLVIAQAENVADGRGITPADFARLRKAGVDFCSGGNWSLYRDDIIPAMSDPAQPIIRPANYPAGTPGLGYKYINGVLVISLLGQIVGKDADKPLDNPLLTIDKILEAEKTTHHSAAIVNFHGDFSSEKVVIGHYLDGRVSAVVGDHWHVPTADARVLPGGTAHITDVGMCGALDASLGVSFDSVVPRWRDGKITRNVLVTKGPRQFNAVLVKVKADGSAESIEQIQQIF